jgi:hypothetical protein
MRSILSLAGGRALRDEGPPRRSNDLVATDSAVLLIGGLCMVAGIMHVGVAANDIRLSSSSTPLVAMLAAFQLGWAALAVLRPSRGALIWGAAVNAAIVALWVTSRTVGVPIGPQPWVPEPVGAVDVIAVLAESVIVLAASCVVLAARSELARRSVPRIAPLLVGVLFISVLYGVGGVAHVGGGGSVWLCS